MVTKEQFDAVYAKYPANWLIKFMFRFFSKRTERKDMSFKRGMIIFLAVTFGCCFAFTVAGLVELAKCFVLAYGLVLIPLIVTALAAHLMNNARIEKIADELKISVSEYNSASAEYYPD